MTMMRLGAARYLGKLDRLDRFPRHMTGRRRCGSSGLKDGLRPTVRGVWTLTINIASKLGHIVRVRKEHYRSGDTL